MGLFLITFPMLVILATPPSGDSLGNGFRYCYYDIKGYNSQYMFLWVYIEPIYGV